MYILTQHVYISIVCFIKLTSSNGYKSRKFVSLIDAPYFKNAFAPGASIRRNTVHVMYNILIELIFVLGKNVLIYPICFLQICSGFLKTVTKDFKFFPAVQKWNRYTPCYHVNIVHKSPPCCHINIVHKSPSYKALLLQCKEAF